MMDVSKYCSEQDIEACVLKLKLSAFNIYVVRVYRAPCGNFNSFLNRLDSIIMSIYKIERKLIICGDTNIDCLTVSDRRRQLGALLLSCNLTQPCPTRRQRYTFLAPSVSTLFEPIININSNFKTKNIFEYLSTVKYFHKISFKHGTVLDIP
jgi:hypothetical protein